MSRVFVSCAYRDRAVGDELGSIVRALGHEPVDDHDDARGTAWWNEVVGRIEASDVFVAVASPAYAEAHACRLAAKHAAASGLPVVRVDLGQARSGTATRSWPAAVGVPLRPRGPRRRRPAGAGLGRVARRRLDARARATSPDEPLTTTGRRTRAAEARLVRADRTRPTASGRRVSSPVLGRGGRMVLVAAGLVCVGLEPSGRPESRRRPTPDVATMPESAPDAVGEPPRRRHGLPPWPALLAGVEAVDSPGCRRARARPAPTRSPAPTRRRTSATVVLTPYATRPSSTRRTPPRSRAVSGGPCRRTPATARTRSRRARSAGTSTRSTR